MPQLIECTKNTQIPKTKVWSYGKCASFADALRMHEAKGRIMPAVVYVFRGEYFFPVVGEA